MPFMLFCIFLIVVVVPVAKLLFSVGTDGIDRSMFDEGVRLRKEITEMVKELLADQEKFLAYCNDREGFKNGFIHGAKEGLVQKGFFIISQVNDSKMTHVFENLWAHFESEVAKQLIDDKRVIVPTKK